MRLLPKIHLAFFQCLLLTASLLMPAYAAPSSDESPQDPDEDYTPPDWLEEFEEDGDFEIPLHDTGENLTLDPVCLPYLAAVIKLNRVYYDFVLKSEHDTEIYQLNNIRVLHTENIPRRLWNMPTSFFMSDVSYCNDHLGAILLTDFLKIWGVRFTRYDYQHFKDRLSLLYHCPLNYAYRLYAVYRQKPGWVPSVSHSSGSAPRRTWDSGESRGGYSKEPEPRFRGAMNEERAVHLLMITAAYRYLYKPIYLLSNSPGDLQRDENKMSWCANDPGKQANSLASDDNSYDFGLAKFNTVPWYALLEFWEDHYEKMNRIPFKPKYWERRADKFNVRWWPLYDMIEQSWPNGKHPETYQQYVAYHLLKRRNFSGEGEAPHKAFKERVLYLLDDHEWFAHYNSNWWGLESFYRETLIPDEYKPLFQKGDIPTRDWKRLSSDWQSIFTSRAQTEQFWHVNDNDEALEAEKVPEKKANAGFFNASLAQFWKGIKDKKRRNIHAILDNWAEGAGFFYLMTELADLDNYMDGVRKADWGYKWNQLACFSCTDRVIDDDVRFNGY
ncbi:MAG: hypothetical protein N0E40_19190 [Candidatus Thiodiazotropha taylori]|nr:hypothetical protein [Candidatus Thiodiazotropha taylori]MCG8051931.1 hypothetical protein [Candidatus Thiodiazotropha taylori]MCW4306099.1 hypothetical protein [Candidatus Thiodiazotropha taylori]MCW4313753.1 hypothetical protein [Candidatus Thiodiazotropha taylori]